MRAPVTAAHAARGTLAARARYLVGNNPLAAAGVQAWVSQAVGVGIKPSSLHADAGTRDALTARFTEWTDQADDEGRTDFYGVQADLFKSMVTTGEGLALMISTPAGLRIRVLDPEQLDASHTVALDNGARVISGVEFDRHGQRVAYHIFDHPPGLDAGFQRQRRRVPAEDVIHTFRRDWPGQVRGISWFAPVLLRLADLDSWSDAQLTARCAASLAPRNAKRCTAPVCNRGRLIPESRGECRFPKPPNGNRLLSRCRRCGVHKNRLHVRHRGSTRVLRRKP
ncbi:phage portal protein [Mesorhizobium xinjiangense]|uniref:phage portal protein n=1 Tax=Mesorhizobium xinjiangense TaxID=2678685 RepID=UPI0038B2507B